MLGFKEVHKQSQRVWDQFGESVWKPNAKVNAKLERRGTEELRNSGLGKTLVSVAMGASLENKIETLKTHRDKFDLICCDKAFKPLAERGIIPDYVLMADANIETRWIDGVWDKTKDVKLLATPYANPKWTQQWQGPRYFYINMDAIDSQKVFNDIMGPGLRNIPASSNVSNAQVVFMTGADNESRVNFAGYSKILLVGYDYSWKVGGNYYAWNNPVPKRYYMTHKTIQDMNRDLVRTSDNLTFSAKWLYTYITSHKLPVVNCSGQGLLDVRVGNLEVELKDLRPCAETGKKAQELLKILTQKSKDYAEAKQNLAQAVEV